MQDIKGIEQGEILVLWCSPLENREYFYSRLNYLNEFEKSKFEKIIPEKEKYGFLAGRVMVKQLLGRLLGLEPFKVKLKLGKYEKPGLDWGTHRIPYGFSISHSDTITIVAISKVSKIGCDIESVRNMDFGRIARRFMSPHEADIIFNEEESRQMETFFYIWTVKEAYIKAVGKGFTIAPDSFSVSFPTPGVPKLLFDGIVNDNSDSWEIFTPFINSEFKCSIALKPELNLKKASFFLNIIEFH